MEIKVLGSGCKKCNQLEQSTLAALKELNLNHVIEHVTDFTQIASYGVMTTPALVIDNKVVSYGKVLKKEEVIKILQKANIIVEGRKPRVAFVCVHNSCRSQMAEALGKLFASEVYDSYSAGTEIKTQINQDAVRMIKDIYNVDMEKTQHNKLIEDIPSPDVVIFMGCNVSCPNLKAQYKENWGLDDPSGKSDEEFKLIISIIEEKVKELANKLK